MTSDDVFDDDPRSDDASGDDASGDDDSRNDDVPGDDDGVHGDVTPDRGAAAARPPSPAAAASNWRTVVVADMGMGVAVIVVGMVLAFVWQPVIGAGIASLGLVYTVLAGRRASQWADWRRHNGLG